tara:strand:+ start:400 stop:1578 length:1179 start_codon:yes stop_codon:yes gene_type:complete
MDDNTFISNDLFDLNDEVSVLLWIPNSDNNSIADYSRKRYELKKYACLSFAKKLIQKNLIPIFRSGKKLEDIVIEEIKNNDIQKVVLRFPIYNSEKQMIKKISDSYPHLDIKYITLANLINQKTFIQRYGFPKSFTKFRKIVEKNNLILEPVDTIRSFKKLNNNIIKNNKIDKIRDVENFTIKNFLFYMKKSLPTYKQTRYQLYGNNISSGLSIPLSIGTISPRVVFKLIKIFEKNIVSNQSTYWLKFELLWREYFKLLSYHYGSNIFNTSGIFNQKEYPSCGIANNLGNFPKLDDDLINSINNQLTQTGYISNRARQIFSSYLIYNKKLNWLAGALYFKKNLIDYDTEINFCNWMYIAGLGTDPRGGRVFNLDKQKSLYDNDYVYRKKWNN